MTNPVTKDEYRAMEGTPPEFGSRWHYCSVAQNLLLPYITEDSRVLEVGPRNTRLFHGSDLLDITDKWWGDRLTYKHDARIYPWPIPGKKVYDVAVMLQVLHHLNGQKLRAFAELRRVCRVAVLSYRKHGKRDKAWIRWTHHMTPKETVYVGRKHVVLLYEFGEE